MLKRWWTKRAVAASQHAQRDRFRPHLELLEDRNLLSAGAIDPTFGQNGTTPPDFDAAATAVVVAGDGKIVVLGQTQVGYEIRRYHANGSPDATFGDQGQVAATFGDDTVVVNLAVLGDGRIVVGGSSEQSSLSVARFNPDGSPDSTFSEDGLTEFALGLTVADMAVRGNSVVVVGTAGTDVVVVRLNADGNLDQSFDGDGLATTPLGADARAGGVALQTDGKIVVTGFGGGELTLLRYRADGSLDPTFDGDGVVSAGLPGATFAGSQVAVDGNSGQLVVTADSFTVHNSYADWDHGQEFFNLFRFNGDGSPDAGFGTAGQVSRSAWRSFVAADKGNTQDVVLQSDGKILVGGNSYGTALVTRYHPDGALDLGYGNGGSAVVSSSWWLGDASPALALQGDGKVVVASDADTGLVLTRLEADSDIRPARFESAAAFRQHLIEQAVRQYSGLFGRDFRYWYYRNYALDYAVTTMAGSASTAVGGAPTYSETNTQVAGVDEGDSVKSDGRYLYLLSNGKLVILDAWPAEDLSTLSETDLSGTPLVQYLHGDRLTVISQEYRPGKGGYGGPGRGEPVLMSLRYGGYYWSDPVVKVTVFDVSDRSAPTVVKETTLDGSYNNSRAVGDTVYVALNTRFAGLPAPEYTQLDDGVVYETEAAYRARMATLPLDALLPRYTTRSYGPDGTHESSGLLNAPEDIYRPSLSDDTNLMSLVALDVGGTDATPTDSVSFMTSYGATLYAAPDNFYLITNRWSYVNNWTFIDRLSLDDGDITLTATGRVPGSILNQFSVGQNGDYLYIATTIGWGQQSSNNVYVLGEDGHALEVVGKVENMAPGETIFSVRFLGDRGFVTTFVRQDPLFALDLSDPTAPFVAGELHVSGFNGYMQAIDATHLIGIGRDENPNTGRVTDFQISLYDVSDLYNPTLVSRYHVAPEGWSWSNAEYDYHAITYYPEYQALALPVSSYRQITSSDGTLSRWTYQTDQLVFHVDAAAGTLELQGTISDASAIQRGVFIGDKLYSISDTSVQVHALEDLETLVAQVELPAPDYSPWWWGWDWVVTPLVVRIEAEPAVVTSPTVESEPEAVNSPPSDAPPGTDPGDTPEPTPVPPSDVSRPVGVSPLASQVTIAPSLASLAIAVVAVPAPPSSTSALAPEGFSTPEPVEVRDPAPATVPTAPSTPTMLHSPSEVIATPVSASGDADQTETAPRPAADPPPEVFEGTGPRPDVNPSEARDVEFSDESAPPVQTAREQENDQSVSPLLLLAAVALVPGTGGQDEGRHRRQRVRRRHGRLRPGDAGGRP